MSEQTPSQTIGPFFHFALPYAGGPELTAGQRADAVRLHGTVLDGAGAPVADALVELWQADAAGAASRSLGSLERDGYAFTGFGRAATDRAGHYGFATVLPGTGFATLALFARGLTHHLFTRAYFDDRPGLMPAAVPPERRATLLAVPDGERSYRFDIRMQGEGETVFLEYPCLLEHP